MPIGHFEEGDARRIAKFVKQNEGKSAVRRSRPRRRAVLTPSPRVFFRTPPEGIPAGQTVECLVTGYSDGRDVPAGPAGDMVMVENRWPELVGDGAQPGYGERWEDHYIAVSVWEDCE